MKAYCKGCKKELDETEWAKIYELSYQTDHCMDCYGEKTAELVIFTKDFTQIMVNRFIEGLRNQNLKRPHRPIRNWINKQFLGYLPKALTSYNFEIHFKSTWELLRGQFDTKVEACMEDNCVGCEYYVK